MKIKKKTMAMIRRVQKAILAEPALYDQDRFPGHAGGTDCNTPCCIGGWGTWLEDPEEYYKLLLPNYGANLSVDRNDVARMAQSFGLTERQFIPLYVCADAWPEPFRTAYAKAKTAKQRAQVACDRMDYFITSGGK